MADYYHDISLTALQRAWQRRRSSERPHAIGDRWVRPGMVGVHCCPHHRAGSGVYCLDIYENRPDYGRALGLPGYFKDHTPARLGNHIL